jgi:hypothetical protein
MAPEPQSRLSQARLSAFPARWHSTYRAFANYYNTVRLHSAVGYLTPADRLAGRHLEIFLERDRKLELARQNRKTKRQSLTKSIASSS